MTEFLEKTIEAVRQMPTERQNEIAEWMLDFAEEDGASEPLDPEDMAAIEEGLARGEFATDEEVAAVLRRFTAA